MSETPISDTQRLMDHEYDGIREYDNPTPGWWHMLFWGCIAFSIVYTAVYHFSVFTPSIATRWKAAQTAHFASMFGDVGQLEANETDIARMAVDADLLNYAAQLYQSNCAQCHGADGGGITGPNLTDDHYLHVEEVTDIYDVITSGVVARGMPAWNRLNQNQRVLLTAYVANMRKAPVPGKAPEGDAIPPFELTLEN